MSEISREQGVPGQTVLPGMAEELGYEVIVLKPADERFCWEYVLRNDSPASAYLAAVDAETSREQARKNAHKLLKKEDVRRRIGQIREELRRRYAVTADEIMQYHGRVMKIDRREFVDMTNGRMKSVKDLDPELASILDLDISVSMDGNETVRFLVPGKRAGAVELARLQGLYKDKVELTGKDGGPVEQVVGGVDDLQRFEQLRAKLRGHHGETASPA